MGQSIIFSETISKVKGIRMKNRRKLITTIEKLLILIVAVTILAGIVITIRDKNKKNAETDTEAVVTQKATETQATETETEDSGFVQVGDKQFVSGYTATKTENTLAPSVEAVESTYAILIDESTGEIVAERASGERMNPASMTKILSLLVATEHLESMEQLNETFTITLEMTDFAYVNGLSTVGFLDGEQVPVKDLFYGTILPSGGDAVYALAMYTAGSHEAFVEMMNEKVEELGLSDTAHFSNCAGLYDENNYCTVYDMAMILKAAVENDFCREVLSAHTYTTAPTEQHPDGIVLSNWFLRRIEDKDSGGEVLCAKTGYVVQSGSCSASYQISASGTPYICVTGQAHSSWQCIYDHVAMYKNYAK